MKTWALTLAASVALALGAQNASAAKTQPSFAPLAGLPLLVLHQPRNAAESALVAEIDRATARRDPDPWVRRFLIRLAADLSPWSGRPSLGS